MESRKIINSYLMISGLFTLSASLIWGINTLFLMDAGLDIFQVFIVNAVFTAGMALFEIPTGVFADTLGRKASFLFSLIFLIIGTVLYVLVSNMEDNFYLFCGISIILGIAFTFYSGAVEAWVVDELQATGFKGEMDNVFARGTMFSSLAMLIGTVGGGLLGNIHLSIPYIVRTLILILAALVAFFSMKEQGFTPKPLNLKNIPREMKKIAIDSITYGYKHPSIKLIMIMTAFQMAFIVWGWYAWQPFFLELFGDKDAVWLAGIIAALISLSMAAGNRCVNIILPRFNKRTHLLLICAGLQALAILGVGMTGSFYTAVGLFLVFMFLWGVMGPIKQAYLHKLIPKEQRATIVSFDSLVGSGSSVIGQSGLGYLSKVTSIGAAYMTSSLITVCIMPALMFLKNKEDDADVIKR